MDFICKDPSVISIWGRCSICNLIYDMSNRYHCNAWKDRDKLWSSMPDIKIRKRDGFTTLPSSCYSTLLPYQMSQVKDILKKIFSEDDPKLIIDCTSHIGGDSLHFASVFPLTNIIALDKDPDALKCMQENIKKLNLEIERFQLIHSDCVKWIRQTLVPADLYYFDPPWGGPSYLEDDSLNLYLEGENIVEIINYILKLDLTRKILLKAPKNFQYKTFEKRVNGKIRLFFITKPKKGHEIAYLLILIEPFT